MSRYCSLSGTKPLYGNKVSHAQNKTRRCFLPNLQKVHLRSEFFGKTFSLRVTARTMRTLDKLGGFDVFLTKTSPRKLPSSFASLGRQLRAYKAGKPPSSKNVASSQK